MSSEKKQESHFIFLNITVAIWATVMFVLFPACSGGEKNLAELDLVHSPASNIANQRQKQAERPQVIQEVKP